MSRRSLWALAILVLLAFGPVSSEPTAPTDPDSSAALAKFFHTMKEQGGKAALESISDTFQPDESSGRLLALKIDEMVSTFGTLESYEFLGRQTIGDEGKYAEIAYVSYHRLGPVLWEASVYRREAGWVILKLKFSTER